MLCKTTTRNDQNLRCLENVNDGDYFLNFYFEFDAVLHIQVLDSLTVINNLNDFRVSQVSWEEFKFIYLIDIVLGVAVVFVNSLLLRLFLVMLLVSSLFVGGFFSSAS